LLEYFLSGGTEVSGARTQAVYIAVLLLGGLAFLRGANATRARGFKYGILFLMTAIGVMSVCDLAAGATAALPLLHDVVGAWLTFIVLKFACDTPRGARAITAVFVACACINSLVGVWGAVTKRTLFNASFSVVGNGSFGYDAHTGRAGGFIGENGVGMYSLPALVVGIWLITRKRWRLAGIAIASLSAAAIVLSLSRTSAISGLTGVLFFVVLGARRKRSTLLLLAIPLLAVYFGAGYVNSQKHLWTGRMTNDPASVGYRFSAEGLTNETRIGLWEFYLGEAMTDPILGRGSGYIASQFSVGANIPHNSFLDMLVEYGLIGLLLYMSAFALVCRAWVRCRGRTTSVLPDLMMSCFVGMTVSLLTLSLPLARPVWAMAGSVAGVCLWAGRMPRVAPVRLRGRLSELAMAQVGLRSHPVACAHAPWRERRLRG
jgi:hypothetical protein